MSVVKFNSDWHFRRSNPGLLLSLAVLLCLILPGGIWDCVAQDIVEQPADSEQVPALVLLDSLAALADSALSDSLAIATVPLLPDTVWALQLTRVDNLDSALTWHDRLNAEGLVNFARVQARLTEYWYEVYAGPVATQAFAESLAIVVRMLDGNLTLQLEQAHQDDLLRGLVTAPISGISAINGSRKPSSALQDSSSVSRIQNSSKTEN